MYINKLIFFMIITSTAIMYLQFLLRAISVWHLLHQWLRGSELRLRGLIKTVDGRCWIRAQPRLLAYSFGVFIVFPAHCENPAFFLGHISLFQIISRYK